MGDSQTSCHNVTNMADTLCAASRVKVTGSSPLSYFSSLVSFKGRLSLKLGGETSWDFVEWLAELVGSERGHCPTGIFFLLPSFQTRDQEMFLETIRCCFYIHGVSGASELCGTARAVGAFLFHGFCLRGCGDIGNRNHSQSSGQAMVILSRMA